MFPPMAGIEGPLRAVLKAHADALALGRAWKICGVYRLQFPDGSFYVGSSSDIRGRICKHIRDLVNGKHNNLRISRHWTRFGVVEAYPLLLCRKEDALLYEQLVMDNFDPPLNLRMRAQAPVWSEGSRQKISQAHSGKITSGETRERISKSKAGQGAGNSNRKGKASSPAEVERLARYMKGNQYRKGTVLTQEHKDKISAYMKQAWTEKRANANG